jgi:hypothetical protein
MSRQGFLLLAQPLMEPSTVDTSGKDNIKGGREQDTNINCWFLGHLTMLFQLFT